MNGFIRFLLFSNCFYGLCVLGLSVEASMQLHIPLNSGWYYLFVFIATVLYYTHAYIGEQDTDTQNERAHWYRRHKRSVTYSQAALTVLFLLLGLQLLRDHFRELSQMNRWFWILGGIFPVIALLYYGSTRPLRLPYNLRSNGWLKPFFIGLVWAGAVTIYPVLFSGLAHGSPYEPEWLTALLFIKNFMFITMLCIMFDIKDYAADHNRQLKTFVVRYGLRKTIFFILIPLSVIGLGTFLIYAFLMHFPAARILMNTIPFILLIIVAYSMHRRKSILYYLAIIDGLMLVKAVCGITGMLLIK
ncbi:MAG TPA: UbiA family prenyltransferase [Sediminibacterium sp.]|nr:UbiA family prenyltransferase [Sediminibacterium sp.]